MIGKLMRVPIGRRRPKLGYTINQMQEDQERSRVMPGVGTRTIETPLGMIMKASPQAEEGESGEPVWLS